MNIISKIITYLTGRPDPSTPTPTPAPGTPVKATPTRKRIKPALILPKVPHGGNAVGRGNVCLNYTGRKLYLEKIDTTYDEGYDKGGAYWGLPSETAGVLWCAWCCVERSEFDNEVTEAVRVFVWAHDRAAAKAAVIAKLPNATFYR